MRLNVLDIKRGLVLKWNTGNWDTFMLSSSRVDWEELVFCLPFFSETVFSMLSSTFMHPVLTPVSLNVCDFNWSRGL